MQNIPLIDHINQRFQDNDKAIRAALDAAEKAVNKAEVNAEKWRDNANEWRGAMNDKDKSFALKADVERLSGEIKKLQLSEATLSGKASQNSVLLAYVIAAVSLAIGLIQLFK